MKEYKVVSQKVMLQDNVILQEWNCEAMGVVFNPTHIETVTFESGKDKFNRLPCWYPVKRELVAL